MEKKAKVGLSNVNKVIGGGYCRAGKKTKRNMMSTQS